MKPLIRLRREQRPRTSYYKLHKINPPQVYTYVYEESKYLSSKCSFASTVITMKVCDKEIKIVSGYLLYCVPHVYTS